MRRPQLQTLEEVLSDWVYGMRAAELAACRTSPCYRVPPLPAAARRVLRLLEDPVDPASLLFCCRSGAPPPHAAPPRSLAEQNVSTLRHSSVKVGHSEASVNELWPNLTRHHGRVVSVRSAHGGLR